MPLPSVACKQLADMIKAASPQFVRMGVMNRDGISVAYSPQKDKAGNSTIGLDFSDRPYMPIIRNNPNPYIGDVVVSRTLPAEYDLPLIARFPGPEFDGFCGGVVNIAQLRDLFDSLIGDRQMTLILVDRNGRVIIGTRKRHRNHGRIRSSSRDARKYRRDEYARLWTPFLTPGATLLHRWHGSVVSAERVLGPEIGLENLRRSIAESAGENAVSKVRTRIVGDVGAGHIHRASDLFHQQDILAKHREAARHCGQGPLQPSRIPGYRLAKKPDLRNRPAGKKSEGNDRRSKGFFSAAKGAQRHPGTKGRRTDRAIGS